MSIALLLSLLSVAFLQDQPKFKGNDRSLSGFLSTSLVYPEFSRQNCLQGTVQVSFSVNRRGQVYNSSVTKGYGTDLDKEALRLVRLTSGKWVVPIAWDTTATMVLPVNFTVSEGLRCQGRDRSDASAAIAAYRSQENLTQVITNYYDNKATGKADLAQESYITGLKEQLGYTEKYYDALVKQASRKLKQGDREAACEDLNLVRRLGSTKADKLLAGGCK